MTKYHYAVTLGRWSIFHPGHRDTVDQCLDLADKVIMIVGSAFESRTFKNPWTFEERVSMILSNYDPKFHNRFIFEPLPDSPYDDDAWYDYIERDIMSKYDRTNAIFVEHAKDDSSFYVKAINDRSIFANWIDPKPSANAYNHKYINASDHRHQLFAFGYDEWEKFNDRELHKYGSDNWVQPETREWIANWIANNPEIYAELSAEYAAILDYRRTMERLADYYPYPINVCASDIVLLNQDRVLLVVRGGTFGKGKLALPGGHLELNETVEQCALRELHEETGLRYNISDLLAMRTFSNPKRSDRWRVISHTGLIIDNGPRPCAIANDDAQEVLWMDLSELNANRHRFFDDHYHMIVETLKPFYGL